MTPASTYIGRFAPTPTGPLHMGSLVAAVASYVDAKAQNGTWLMRIEDLDPPRESPEAKNLIPKQLQAHGLNWDGDIQYQSQHAERYEAVLDTLTKAGMAFPCACSRKQLGGSLHAGQCHYDGKHPAALRLLVPNQTCTFTDRIYGKHQQNLQQAVGDQVLKRKDGLYAYQLAAVVDDEASGITHVVRGADLLDNTERQIYLQQCLNYRQPIYMHLPLVVNGEGQKLSKQNHAKALDLSTAPQNLFHCLQFLNQNPPAELQWEDCDAQLKWAIAHWRPDNIKPSQAGIL